MDPAEMAVARHLSKHAHIATNPHTIEELLGAAFSMQSVSYQILNEIYSERTVGVQFFPEPLVMLFSDLLTAFLIVVFQEVLSPDLPCIPCFPILPSSAHHTLLRFTI
jgi:phosphate/sulfate permease